LTKPTGKLLRNKCANFYCSKLTTKKIFQLCNIINRASQIVKSCLQVRRKSLIPLTEDPSGKRLSASEIIRDLMKLETTTVQATRQEVLKALSKNEHWFTRWTKFASQSLGHINCQQFCRFMFAIAQIAKITSQKDT